MHIVTMLILISLLILVHEFGHFIAAKLMGIRVSKFALGLPFGPTLYRKKCGDTEFLIHAFLLGGYISFPDDEKDAEGKDVLPEDSPLRFKNKKPWQQAIVVSAGVFANIIFAVFVVMLAAGIYHKLPSGSAEVYINDLIKKENGSNAIQAGLKPRDKIVSVNGIKINSSYKFIFMVQKSKYFDGHVSPKIVEEKYQELLDKNPSIKDKELLKAGETIKLPALTPEEPVNISETVASGYEKYITDEIELTHSEKELRNELFGKQKITLEKDVTPKELARALSDSYKPINLVVEREGNEIAINNLYTDREGLLGVKLEGKEIFIPTTTFGSIVKHSCAYLWTNTKNMLFGLWQLVSGKIPFSEMHGIVAIAKIGGDIIESHGMLNGLLLTAIISINLAIINLLPIPALDGGHLLFLFLEKVLGRKLNEEAVDRIANTCFMLLILLMVFVIFNDVFALITKKF